MKRKKIISLTICLITCLAVLPTSFAMYVEQDAGFSFDINVIQSEILERVYLKGLGSNANLNVELQPNIDKPSEMMTTDVSISRGERFEIAVYRGKDRLKNVPIKKDLLSNVNFNNCMLNNYDNTITAIRNSKNSFYSSDAGVWIDVTEMDTPLYFAPNSFWSDANTRYAAYFFGGAFTPEWASMFSIKDTGIYTCNIPKGKGFDSVIFCWMWGDNLNNDWPTKRSQTANLQINSHTENMFTLTNGDANNATGTWSTYQG